jgi:DNA topoisomerase-3
MVKKAKEYDRDTMPGDYATLSTPCPNCGGVVKENYRRYSLHRRRRPSEGCGFSFTKSPAGRTFETAEAEQLLRERRIGPLEGFRSKAGWPFVAEVAIVRDEENSNFKLEFDFGDDKDGEDTGEIVDFAHQQAWAPAPSAARPSSSMAPTMSAPRPCPRWPRPRPAATSRAARSSCSSPSSASRWQAAADRQDRSAGEVRLQPHAPQLQGLPGLGWCCGQGELRVRAARKQVPGAQDGWRSGGQDHDGCRQEDRHGSQEDRRQDSDQGDDQDRCGEEARTVSATLKPSADLAAVIGSEPTSRPDVIKKLWDYIKANGLQDAKDKRAINADAKLKPVFGKEQISMFELAGIVGKHVS